MAANLEPAIKTGLETLMPDGAGPDVFDKPARSLTSAAFRDVFAGRAARLRGEQGVLHTRRCRCGWESKAVPRAEVAERAYRRHRASCEVCQVDTRGTQEPV